MYKTTDKIKTIRNFLHKILDGLVENLYLCKQKFVKYEKDDRSC